MERRDYIVYKGSTSRVFALTAYHLVVESST